MRGRREGRGREGFQRRGRVRERPEEREGEGESSRERERLRGEREANCREGAEAAARPPATGDFL